MRQVAALFVRADSVYKGMAGVDCYDIERDARRWPGGVPGVFHPPCRAWGSLRHFAKPRPDEKDLARWAVRQVREWGGALEHPAASTLWADQSLPEPGQRDRWGGWTLVIYQGWFGHLADKATRLYIVGRPVARMSDDGWTAEVTRCCTDGTRNACSMLYRAAWRAVRALGYRRLQTYTLPAEGGASLRGAGFRLIGQAGGGSWNRAARPRVDTAPTQGKLRWEVAA